MKTIIVFIASIVALSAVLIMLDRSRFGSGPSDWAWQYPTNESPKPPEGAAPAPDESDGDHRSPGDPEPRASPGARSDGPQPRTTRPNTTVEPETWALSRMRSAGARTEILRCVRGISIGELDESESLILRLRFGNHTPLYEAEVLEELRRAESGSTVPALRQSVIATIETAGGRTLSTSVIGMILGADATVLDAVFESESESDDECPQLTLPDRARIGDAGAFPGGGWILERGRGGHARLVLTVSCKAQGLFSLETSIELWVDVDRQGFARVERVSAQNGLKYFLAERD